MFRKASKRRERAKGRGLPGTVYVQWYNTPDPDDDRVNAASTIKRAREQAESEDDPDTYQIGVYRLSHYVRIKRSVNIEAVD